MMMKKGPSAHWTVVWFRTLSLVHCEEDAMPGFAVPLNWEPGYFEALDFSKAVEVYGKLREDFTGGGKSSMAQGEPSRTDVRQAVREAHARGLEFNYLLNTTCIGNLELTRPGHRALRKLLDWLAGMGVDRVTVAMPFLAELTRRHYPSLKVSVSTQAGVNSLEKAKAWRDLGADLITLSHVEMNRDFRELERITRHSGLEVQLIVNMVCRQGCPFVTLHGNFNAHASHAWSKTNRFNVDYYFLSCLARHFSDPLAVLKAGWIRPEDLGLYAELGVRRFKIVERGLTTPALQRILAAYTAGQYEGNFMDLVPSLNKYVFAQPGRFRQSARELFRLAWVNPFRMFRAVQSLGSLRSSPAYAQSLGLHIDNRALDGVARHMKDNQCREKDCAGCDYCPALARRAVVMPQGADALARDVGKFKAVVGELVDGRMF
jgi:collagenase-like PrtC family protease